MESALIVSGTEKSTAFITEMLSAASVSQIATVKSCGEARRLCVERSFDLIIINAPLVDETGEIMARHMAVKGVCQVILIVGAEHFDEISAVTENDGVLTVAKPVKKEVLWSVLKLARAAQNRLSRMNSENSKLKQKIEDIRIIDRAKCLLISHLNMNEQESHRYIEKQAMDMRTTKRVVAEGILRTYEY